MGSTPIQRTDISDSTPIIKKEADIKFETLRSYEQDDLLDMESHMSATEHSMDSHGDDQQSLMMQQDFSGMMAGMSSRLGKCLFLIFTVS